MLAGHASLRDPYNPQGMIDQHALAKLTAEATVKIDHPNNIDYCVGEAFRQLKARKGPFVLNMPQDVQHGAIPDEKWTYRPMYKAKALQPPRQEDIAQAAKILADAKRPTILCGLGAAEGKAEPEVRKLAEYLGAPVATTLLAAGFCAQYPLYLGISGGLGSDLTVDTLAASDVMIVVGASLNEWTTHFGKILENGKKIIQIDDRSDAFGWFARIAVGLEADAKVAVAALLDRLREGGKPGRQPDAETTQKIKQHKPPAISYDDGKSVDPRRAANYLEEKLPRRDRILVFDGGHAAMVTCKALSSPSAENWSLGLDFGAVGQGLSIALGACFARPGKRVTHVTADAAFMMNVADFHTAVSHNLPLTVLCSTTMPWGKSGTTWSTRVYLRNTRKSFSPTSRNWRSASAPRALESVGPTILARSTRLSPSKTAPSLSTCVSMGTLNWPVSWEIAQHLEMTG
jgi:thiamine pyrophosphate-dependent acetolactate synthase large subunit-like protein